MPKQIEKVRRTGQQRLLAAATTILVLHASLLTSDARGHNPAGILDPESFRGYVEFFNHMDDEDTTNAIANAQAWEWMRDNVPYFVCPDPDVERTYYYRWWAFRKHITKTPLGYVVTEFLRPVKHATDFNAISCALGHHVAEGRWIRDPAYIDQYLRFWLTSGKDGGLQRHFHQYSGWAASAVLERWLVNTDRAFVLSILDPLVLDYRTWEQERLLGDGLFWQFDVRDGMEESISGSRTARNARPTINSYMYGNARAIASIAALAGNGSLQAEFESKARTLRKLVERQLWDPGAQFFKTRLESGRLADVRELSGFTPWYFDLPDPGRGYERAWKQLGDPQGFMAPFGPTTAEQRHRGFRIADEGDDCQWNGPSWPFATTVTLRALANVLDHYPQRVVSVDDYFACFLRYTRSHRLALRDGRVIPWIDENLNPFTGVWQARSMKIRKGTFNGRGDHYNHSCYCDPVISGIVGLRPRADRVLEVNPLLPPASWDWFCLDNVSYHGRNLTILWDRTGARFGRGAGLRLIADGRLVGSAATLRPLKGRF